MSQKITNRKGINAIKTFGFSLLFFMVLVAMIGLLVRFTPIPERWISVYMMVALSVSCLVVGNMAGRTMGKHGLLYGLLYSVVFLFLVLVLSILVTGLPSESGILQLKYLLCLICGSIGGSMGVNRR